MRSESRIADNIPFLLIALIVAGAYAVALFAPPYINNFQLKRKAQQACYEAYREFNDAKLKKYLIEEAADLDIVLTEDNISIERENVKDGNERDRRGTYIWIDISYDIEHKWPLIQKYEALSFELHVEEDLNYVKW